MRNFLNRYTKRTFIIAEIGGNHNGDLDCALKMIEEAARCEADAVKFQTYRAQDLVHPQEEALPLARKFFRTQFERFKSLEFTPDQYKKLADKAKRAGILFLSSPFDIESVEVIDPYVPFYKIASGSITDTPLLRHISGKKKPVILSTGMSSLKDIERAVAIFPKDKLVLLHCVSNYPAGNNEINLNTIIFLRNKFGLPVGYSDHSIGSIASICAVSLGAVAIEKHFTLDKHQKLGDHLLSLEPQDFKKMVEDVRTAESMRGGLNKSVLKSEKFFQRRMRKGLYARQDLKKGDRLTVDNMISLRPQRGICASRIDYVVGKRLKTNIKRLEPIMRSMVCDLTI